jgi:hypothetical protein
MEVSQYKVVQTWAKDLDGVFTLADLKVALNEKSEATLYRRLGEFIVAGVLFKVKRGLYATQEASLTAISNRIEPDSYISTGTILAQKAMIGSVPARRVQAVKTGRPRTYECELGIVEHLSIHPRLFFGFVPIQGIYHATAEKAFLDVCYFFFKGKRFSFDPASDVHTQDLDFVTIDNYLNRYDKRFVTFFNRIWRGP